MTVPTYLIMAVLGGMLGGMLAHLGATVDTWQYWVVILIALGIYACGRATA